MRHTVDFHRLLKMEHSQVEAEKVEAASAFIMIVYRDISYLRS